MTHALYGGSFDPVTNGHMDVLFKALNTFDKVTVGVGINPKKNRIFTLEESADLIRTSIREHLSQFPPEEIERYSSKVEVGSFEGAIADYAKEIGATHLVRGLRQVSDFNDEFTLRGIMEQDEPSITMVHFICDAKYLHVSSSTARELAKLGRRVNWLLTPTVEKALSDRLGPK